MSIPVERATQNSLQDEEKDDRTVVFTFGVDAKKADQHFRAFMKRVRRSERIWRSFVEAKDKPSDKDGK